MPRLSIHARTQALYTAYAGRTAAFLACVCACAVFAYGILLLMAVAHAAKITEAQDKEATLATQVSALETQYLAASQALTVAQAEELGYVEPTSVSLVYAQAPALTLNAR